MDQYKLFLEDYFRDHIQDTSLIFLESEDDETEEIIKPQLYKENYYFRDNLQNRYVKSILAKPRNREFIIEFTGKFLDEHSYQLSTAGPIHMFTFGEKEMNPIYEMFGVTPDIILSMYYKMVEDTYFGKIGLFITGFIKNAPHKILITCILIDALQNGYDDIVTCCEYMWAFAEYPLVYRIFWKTGVKEDVMNYTIEHLGTKYKVKKFKNLQGLLKYDSHSSVVSQKSKLEMGVDNAYIDLTIRMRNQMKPTFRNIARAYYANDKLNATQHSKSSQFDDGSMSDQEGHTTNIAKVIDSTIAKFSTGGVNNAIIRMAAEQSQVDKDNLTGYINQINSTKNNRMNKIIENIITVYFNKNPTNTAINSSEFLNFGLSLYRSIGTSKDPMYQEIKSILNYWIYEIINIKQFYQREGTWINYTRAVFNYVVIMIIHHN